MHVVHAGSPPFLLPIRSLPGNGDEFRAHAELTAPCARAREEQRRVRRGSQPTRCLRIITTRCGRMFGWRPVTYSALPKLGNAESISRYEATTSQPAAPIDESSLSFVVFDVNFLAPSPVRSFPFESTACTLYWLRDYWMALF